MAAGSTYPIWGWGLNPGDEPSVADLAGLAPLAGALLGTTIAEPVSARPLPELPPDRVGPRLRRQLTVRLPER